MHACDKHLCHETIWFALRRGKIVCKLTKNLPHKPFWVQAGAESVASLSWSLAATPRLPRRVRPSTRVEWSATAGALGPPGPLRGVATWAGLVASRPRRRAAMDRSSDNSAGPTGRAGRKGSDRLIYGAGSRSRSAVQCRGAAEPRCHRDGYLGTCITL